MTIVDPRFDVLTHALAEQGIRCIFGFPHSDALPTHSGLKEQSDLSYVAVRREDFACFSADGYARSTGDPAAVFITSGAGATKAISGIANAYLDSIPMLVVSGISPNGMAGDNSFLETDVIGMSRPVVKHSYIVRRAADIPHVIASALYIARTGRPGPVVVDISQIESTLDPTEVIEPPQRLDRRSYRPPDKGHVGQVKKAVRALLGCNRPLIYAGGGVIQGNAYEELNELVEITNSPVVCSMMGLGAISSQSDNYLGILGSYGTYIANRALKESDFVLALGVRFDERVIADPKGCCPNATIVHVDIDSTSIGTVIPTEYPIVGSCKAVLNQKLNILTTDSDSLAQHRNRVGDWWNLIASWRATTRQNSESSDSVQGDGRELDPRVVVQELHRATNGSAIVATDIGQHQIFVAQNYGFREPRHWLSSCGLATMGYGLSAAIGAQVAHPQALVVCITGDSSFLLSSAELATSQEYLLPIKILNFNNGGLGMLHQQGELVQDSSGERAGLAKTQPNYVDLVSAFGILARQVQTLDELRDSLSWVFSDECASQTVFLDIRIDSQIQLDEQQV